MARLPTEQVNRIKQDVSLLRLVESQGYEITKQGKDYAVCCPFHDDKTPSCIISTKSNLFNCFGCGAGGSVIDWVMKTQGVSFRFACESLMKDIHVVTDKPEKVVKRSSTKKLTSSLAADLYRSCVSSTHGTSPSMDVVAADTVEAVHQVVDYYHQTLLDSPEALAYLEKRGLNYPELINTFRLGFANRTLAYHIPDNNRDAGKHIRSVLKDVGLLRSTGHEHFNGSLVVPVTNASGDVVEIYGRKITRGSKLTKGTPLHLYLPGPHAGVFNVKGLTNAASAGSTGAVNAEGLVGQVEIILCESLIDAMTFWVQGFTHVTASYGTQGFTDDHLALFKQLNIKRVLLAYDRDQAGDAASEKVAELLQDNHIDCFRILFPQGMDANQYVVEADSPSEARERLSAVIRKAQWLGNGKAPERQTELDLLPPEPEQEMEDLALLADQPLAGADLIPKEDWSAEPELPHLPASPLPERLTGDIRCEVTDKEITLGIDDRVYRVRGLNRNQIEGQLKINLMACNDNGFHTDTLELYHAKQRQVFINQASVELGVKDEVIKKDVGKVLLKLESLQDEQRLVNQQNTPEKPCLTPAQHDAAMALLTDNNLLDRIGQDFKQLGLIGEETNKLVGYLACVSRKLEKPLGVVIQSSSAAGKSSLMDSILQLMPGEERVQYSAMTGQSLFYMGETNLKHKILAIAEEEGASNASYALKLLQSEGEITIASTGKDDSTGDLVTKEYRVEGPTQLFMTTTAIDVDEELMNRCLILSVDESKAQTEAIHAQQRYAETLAGVFAKATKHTLIEQHQNAQRLLKPYAIVNPYAEQLRFLSDKTRTRRDHMKYLTLIKTITLLHQYQREIKVYKQGDQSLEYIEVTLADIDQANALVHQVLGKSLDELPPQTRNLLNQIHQWVTAHCAAKTIAQSDCRFSRREVRDLTGWSEKQTRKHLDRLMEMEYLLVHRGARGQSYVYELLYEGEGIEGDPFMLGLQDIDRLSSRQSSTTTDTSTPIVDDFDPLSSPVRSVLDRSSLPCRSSPAVSINGASSKLATPLPQTARLG